MDSHFYGTAFFVDEIQDALARLTADDVNAAITRHLQYDNLAIAIVTSDAEAFRAKLLSNDSSPITYNTEVSDEILEEDQTSARFTWRSMPIGYGSCGRRHVQVRRFGTRGWELGTCR